MMTAVLELNVSGMICRACEDAIADALLHTRGVISAQGNYWRSRVTITYDPDIVTEDALRQVLTNAGYPPGAHGMGGVVVDLICLALVGVLYWGLPKLLMLVQVPALAEHASLGLVFLVGLLTSTHCIGMCGGILLAQTTDAHGVTGRSKRGLIASAAYNGGRVVSYTAEAPSAARSARSSPIRRTSRAWSLPSRARSCCSSVCAWRAFCRACVRQRRSCPAPAA